MDDTTTRLGEFVAAKDSRLACAAAVVLAELAPRDGAVVRQLVAALESADTVRRPFIIEALGRIGTADAAAALVPLIKTEGPASELALRALAHTASAALKPLLKLVGSVPPALLERIAECAARTGETAAFQGLFAGLVEAPVEACRAVRGGLRTALNSFDDASRERLRRQLAHGFRDKVLVAHQPSLIALMKIAGDLGDPALQADLLPYMNDGHPAHVRRAALLAIAMLRLTGEQRARLAGRLLPLLFDPDQANIAEPALEALRQARLGAEQQNQLRKLLSSPSSRIREFAMQALATQGTSRTIQELIGCLDSPERSVREEALGALSRAPAAAGPLCERLLELDGGESATETARALAPQAARVPPKPLEKLAGHYVALAVTQSAGKTPTPDTIRKTEEKRRAIFGIFRASNSPLLVAAVAAQARKLRLDDEAVRAHELLKSVSGLNGWNDEYRVEMALAGLSFGPKELARAARASDPNLRVLEDVLVSAGQQPKELARTIVKDPALSRKTLYYLGFHFVERMRAEREFGQMLLTHLAAIRSDEGRQAKEKLVIEGLAKVKGAKAGILEERAKVLMSAADMSAAERAREEKENKKGRAARPAAKAKKAGKRR